MPYDGMQLGRYHLLRILGSGGMGEVYLADDTRINRQVAVKVIRTEASSYSNAEGTSRNAHLFEREMKMISKLDHPHILPLFDYGEDTISGSKITYMVMPYRPEGSLTTWLAQRKTTDLLPPQDVAYFIAQAASALQYAHNNQIIHQDVKPSNFLMRNRQEQPQRPDLLLADFGVARFSTNNSNTSQTIRGTPAYMSPEQWEGQPTYESDQYALAIMTYELLVGRSAFEGGVSQMMYKHLMTQPDPPSQIQPSLPREVDAVILRALAKKSEDRYPNINAYASALQQALHVNSGMYPGMTSPASVITPPIGHDIPVQLAITAHEALYGTVRTLTIGKQRVTITVPAGAYTGQVIRLENWDTSLLPQDAVNPLVVTLAIQATTAISTIAASADALPGTSMADLPASFGQRAGGASYPGFSSYPPANRLTSGPHTPIDPADQTMAYENVAPQYSAAQPSYGQQYNRYGQYYPPQPAPAPPEKRSFSSGTLVFLIVLVVLLIIGSAGAIAYFATTANTSANNANATATAVQSLFMSQTQTATSLGSANLTGTAIANGTATVTAGNGTATATAGNRTATATTGNQNATATAVAIAAGNATGTAVAGQTATAQASPDPTGVTPAFSVNKTVVAATANASSTDCIFGPQAGGSTTSGWTCQIVLSNKGNSVLSWTSSNTGLGAANTNLAPSAHPVYVYLLPQVGNGVYTLPANGNLEAQASQNVSLIVLDSKGGGACPTASTTFIFTGQTTTVQVQWTCQ